MIAGFSSISAFSGRFGKSTLYFMLRSSLLPATSQSRRATPKVAIVVKTRAGDTTSRSIGLRRLSITQLIHERRECTVQVVPGEVPELTEELVKSIGRHRRVECVRSKRLRVCAMSNEVGREGCRIALPVRVKVANRSCRVEQASPSPPFNRQNETEQVSEGNWSVGSTEPFFILFYKGLVPLRSESCHFLE